MSDSGEALQQRCWACGCSISVPLGEGGRPLPLFKCGWCSAANSPAEDGTATRTADPGAPRLMLEKARTCRPLPGAAVAGRTLIPIVLLLIGSVFVLGLSLVLPALFSPLALALFHGPLALLLAFNILFNYASCILRPAGPVQHHLQRSALDSGGRLRRGALEGCQYCYQCCYYKPPSAHHCRSCGCCMVEMDHHCWYINNCVGAGNLRHFLLFLAYLVAGTGYGLALGLLMGWRDRAMLWQHTLRVLQGTHGMQPVLRMLSFSLTWLLWAPAWLACWAYFTFVCWATFVSVGLLFARQFSLVLRGRRYLDTLSRQLQQRQHSGQAGSAPAPPAGASAPGERLTQTAPAPPLARPPAARPAAAAACTGVPAVAAAAAAAPSDPSAPVPAPSSTAIRNLRRVFGSGHPLTWLLPSWEVLSPPTAPSPASSSAAAAEPGLRSDRHKVS